MESMTRALRAEIAHYERKRDWCLEKKLYRVAAKHQRSIDGLLKRIEDINKDSDKIND